MWPLTLLYLNTPGLMEKVESMLRALFLLACGQPEALSKSYIRLGPWNPRTWPFALKFCVTKSKRSQKYLSFNKNFTRIDQVTQCFLANTRLTVVWSFWDFELKLTGKFPLDMDSQRPSTLEAAPLRDMDTDCNYSDFGCCCLGSWPF